MATSVTVSFTATNDEEFVGPFPSWRNVKTHYGAVGDGLADDTAAIQNALTELEVARENGWSVLYFPAGTYKITRTLTTNRTDDNGYKGCQILGEDPATTKLVWGSVTAENMFDLDGWYLKVGRLSFDGNNVAVFGLRRYNSWSTSCALVDLWFENLAIGIYFDGVGAGQAEQLVQRCHFVNCSSGIVTLGQNSMDIWVWNSLFEDCEFGIKCITGAFNAYNNVFLRSRGGDMTGSTHSGFCCIVGNTSIDSRNFVDGISKDGLPGNGFSGGVYIARNAIYDPTLANHAKAVIYVQGQPLILLDNIIASLPGASGAVVGWSSGGPRFAVNNAYTVSSWAMQPGANLIHATNAFDNDAATDAYGSNWCRNNAGNAWLQYSFCYGHGPALKRKVINGYAITAASGAFSSQMNPAAWVFEASNDGATWEPLHSSPPPPNLETFSAGDRKEYHFSNTTAYCMYRLQVTDNSSLADEGGVRIAELELLEGTTDQTDGGCGLATAWGHAYATDSGETYVLNELYFAKSSVDTPTTVLLPGVPPKRTRPIYEVPPGASACTIQTAIYEAAADCNRAVVHIPAYSSKGKPANYNINTTLIVPANADIQIIGDGGKMNATTLTWTGTGHGPVLRIEGPTHCIVRDIMVDGVRGIVADDATAVQLTNADQDSGEVFLEGCVLNAGTDIRTGEAAFYLTGNDDTNVTAIGTSAYGFMRYGVKAIGGPKLTAGVPSNGRFANISGGGSNSNSLISFVDVQNGAKIAHEGVYLEAGGKVALQAVRLQSCRGRVAFTHVRFSTYTSNTTPTFLVADYEGELAMLGCYHAKLGSVPGHWFQLSGDGSATKAMVLGSGETDLWNDKNEIWKDTTSPAAEAAYWMSPVCNVSNKTRGAVPSEQFIHDSIAFARSIRAPLPQPGIANGITAVRFYECFLQPGQDQYGLRIDGPTIACATPNFCPSSGASPALVTISTTTPGATIHYTTDGSPPTQASPRYTRPVSIASTSTLKAIASKSGFLNSAVQSGLYH
jgi:hypothetical protein